MTIFDNDFLENLKQSLIKCNTNISQIEDLQKNLAEKNTTSIENILNNTQYIENFLYSIIPLIEKYLQEQASVSIPSIQENIEKSNLTENTLIVSETKGKIILPYYLNDLEALKNEENTTYEDIIDKKYTIPISAFKSLSISRFKEAFNLAHKKEKKSLKYSFDLAMELLFNYNLHPAIIAACRNLDELDIYLDCLDSGEIEKFTCFNIVFEIPPVIYKK